MASVPDEIKKAGTTTMMEKSKVDTTEGHTVSVDATHRSPVPGHSVMQAQRGYKKATRNRDSVPFGNRAPKTKLDAVLAARGL